MTDTDLTDTRPRCGARTDTSQSTSCTLEAGHGGPYHYDLTGPGRISWPVEAVSTRSGDAVTEARRWVEMFIPAEADAQDALDSLIAAVAAESAAALREAREQLREMALAHETVRDQREAEEAEA